MSNEMSSNKKRTHDEAYEDVWDEVDALRKENARLVKEVEDLQQKLASNEDDYSDDEDSDDESLCDGSAFSKNYFLLKEYKAKHGDCKVPQAVAKLGKFVDNCRTRFKKGKLAQDRIDRLNKLGFFWGKGYPEPKTWDDYLRELKERKDLTGKPDVHVDKDPSKMTDLAKWVVEQRKQGRRLYKGKVTKMTNEQYKALDGINFNWNGPRGQKSRK